MITEFKMFEGSGFGDSYPGHIEPTPKFKIGDEVVVMYDLKSPVNNNYPYGIIKGEIVTITDFWINANGHISYNIDNKKIKIIKKGIDTSRDRFPEFNFEYEWEVNAKKYNL